MRQSTATWAIVAAVVVVLAALAIFGFGRGWWWHGDHHGDGHHGDQAGHMHDESDVHDGGQGDHHGESSSEPSGELVDGVRMVEITARKFEFDPATIVVREGERVRLKVTSEDVTHGMGIEAYDIDRKLEPDKTETIEFTADKPGPHHFHCTVYCGTGHDEMHGELRVLSAE